MTEMTESNTLSKTKALKVNGWKMKFPYQIANSRVLVSFRESRCGMGKTRARVLKFLS